MLTGFGAGAVAASLIQIRGNAGSWIIAFLTACGATLVALVLAPGLAGAVAMTAVLGLLSGPLAVAGSVLAQQHTPDKPGGRVVRSTG